jgi:hypothetical protein
MDSQEFFKGIAYELASAGLCPRSFNIRTFN